MEPEDMIDENVLDMIESDDVEIEVEEVEIDSEFKPKSRSEVEGIVQDAIASAVDFVESEISQDRIKAQRYYDGEVDIGFEDGRSKVVATKVRDTVRAVKPSLMRVFLSTSKPVGICTKGRRGRCRRCTGH